MRLIRGDQMKSMPWKNGGGVTTEVAIAPEGVDFSTDAFLWRVSCAEIRESGPFSVFKEYDRLLTVLKGDGLKIDGADLLPGSILRFSGDKETVCELIAGPVTDLGVVFDRNFVAASMQFIAFESFRASVELKHGCNLIFCLNGRITVDQVDATAGDAVEILGTSSLAHARVIARTPDTRALLINLPVL